MRAIVLAMLLATLACPAPQHVEATDASRSDALRREATGVLISGTQVAAIASALVAFQKTLAPDEKLAQFDITSYRRGGDWVVLFSKLGWTAGGIEYTLDPSGERIIQTVGGP